ncbi:MAG: ABC transporter ATP-binding protein [Lachnospiraceae bacterium]|nr:ABC transporter ATP-binding protein [Lachnospiraceae bacterium]
MNKSVTKDIISYFRRSYQEFGNCRGKLWISTFLLLLVQASGLFETYVLAGITDSLYKQKEKGFFIYLAVAAIVGLSTIIIGILNARMDIEIRQKVIVDLKTKALSRLCGRNEKVERYTTGEQNSIIQDDCGMLVSYVYQMRSYLFSFVVIIYIGITLISISPRWAAIFAVVQVSVGILQRKGVKKIKEKSQECLIYENEFQRYLNEELNEMHAIRFENLGKDIVSFAVRNLELLRKRRLNQTYFTIKLTTASEGIMYLGKMLLFLGMGYEILHGRISMKEYIVFYSYMSTFSSNFMTVIQMLTSLQPTLLNVRRIVSVIDEIESESKSLTSLETLEFVSVEKAFGEKVLFSDVNLRMDLKKSHAILGMNGSGKTTLVKMLMGEEAVSAGTLLVDGRSMEGIRMEEMCGMCYYAAKPSIFSGMTVRENLLLGLQDKDIGEDRLWTVCDDFLFREDIKEMSNGMDSILGKEVNLSSGQMKKVELIRAALGDAEVIILDEPLANLDEAFKYQFQKIFEKYFRSRKIIIIEHDKRRVPFADKVLSISNEAISW